MHETKFYLLNVDKPKPVVVLIFNKKEAESYSRGPEGQVNSCSSGL